MAYSGLTNPTQTAARYAEQSGYDPLQQQAILATNTATGVQTGCLVTAQATPNTTVAVASGTVVVNGTTATVSSGNVSGYVAPSAGLRRIDLVVADNTGAKSRLAGTATIPADLTHAGPSWPSAFDPTTYAVLAEVIVDASDTTIVAGCIIDKRVFTNAPYEPLFRQGLASARPAASVQKGYYFATDTGVLSHSDLSVWSTVAAPAATSVMVPAIAWVNHSGTPSFVDTAAYGWPIWELNHGGNRIIKAALVLPPEWATFNMSITYFDRTNGGVNGFAYISCNYAFATGGAAPPVMSSASGNLLQVPHGNLTPYDALQTAQILTGIANQPKPLGLYLERWGNDSHDTSTDPLLLLWATITKAS